MNEKNDIEELLNYSIYLLKKESIFRNKYIDFKHSITKKDFIEKNYLSDSSAYIIFKVSIFLLSIVMGFFTVMVIWFDFDSVLRTILKLPIQSKIPQILSIITIVITIILFYKYFKRDKNKKISYFYNYTNNFNKELNEIKFFFNNEKKEIIKRLSLHDNKQSKIKEYYYISKTQDFQNLEDLKNIHLNLNDNLGADILNKKANDYIDNIDNSIKNISSNYRDKVKKIKKYEKLANSRNNKIHKIKSKSFYPTVTSSTRKKLFFVKLFLSILYFIAGFLTFITGVAYNLSSTTNIGLFLLISGFGIIPFLINYFANINNIKSKTHTIILPILKVILKILGGFIHTIVVIVKSFKEIKNDQSSSSPSRSNSYSSTNSSVPSNSSSASYTSSFSTTNYGGTSSYNINNSLSDKINVSGDEMVIRALKGEIDSGELYGIETNSGFQADRLYQFLLDAQDKVDYKLSNASYGFHKTGKKEMKGVENSFEYEMRGKISISIGSKSMDVTKYELQTMKSTDGLINVAKSHGILK